MVNHHVSPPFGRNMFVFFPTALLSKSKSSFLQLVAVPFFGSTSGDKPKKKWPGPVRMKRLAWDLQIPNPGGSSEEKKQQNGPLLRGGTDT